MKRNVTLFPKGNYASPTGNPVFYFHDDSLWEVLGQAKSFRFHIVVHKLSATARATFTIYESGIPGQAPNVLGGTVGAAIVINAAGQTIQTQAGPTMGRVMVTLAIDDTGGPAAQDMDLEAYVTLILEE
jgi:hypothetical protein